MQQPKKHRNRLADESSPYLQQHAHNPVDWFPWGEEAFEKARAEDKPVLLSIGYSACHWCHVMEHESFEDERIAALMNEHFVNIKVDMEERPDVDKIYMNFVQVTTGSGGWPMTVFLTPDQRPFFGGTYFPPQPRFNLPSFEQILLGVSEAYSERRDEVLHSANDVLGEIRRIEVSGPGESFTPELMDIAFRSFERTFDRRNGGFGGAPKFPAPMSLEFLMRYHERTGNETAFEILERTFGKMAHGGIYDQLGGGFHRYTVDANWLTPHFEKMLYDNAQLVRAYVHFYQVTKDPFYKRIVEETLAYVSREMLSPEGGFYSAQDADSEGEEGRFFVWDKAEVEGIVGSDSAEAFCLYYDITDGGNFEGKNILNVKRTVREVCAENGIDEQRLISLLEEGRSKLFEAREKRIKPFRDEKVLTAWNGLMLAAVSEAALALSSDEYLETARKNADFLLSELRDAETGRLFRTWKDGKAKLNAYLEDYANLADGLIELHRAGGGMSYLEEAKRLAEIMISEFWDDENGGFFFTSNDHEELLVRSKDFNDNATPSGNSGAADVLLKLSRIYGSEEFERHANGALRQTAAQIARYPGAFGRALSAMEFSMQPSKEIVVIGERESLIEEAIAEAYLPFSVVVRADGEGTGSIPLLEGRGKVDDRTTVYVCENHSCKLPVTDGAALREQLD